jgi:CRISPR-associated endonuclease/helicase Cas3
VAIGQARKWLGGFKSGPVAWTPDHLASGAGRWAPVTDVFGLRPGATVVVAAVAGGYDPTTGWNASVKRAVPVVPIAQDLDVDDLEVATTDEGVADDPASFTGAWVQLDDHLADAGRAAADLVGEVATPGLTPAMKDAVVRAARLHDLGKAHDVFQDTLVRSAPDRLRGAARSIEPLAKSGGPARSRHSRRYFRHELVSALILTAHAGEVLADDPEPDLVRYLVAAHHGRVRLAIRSIPGEAAPPDRPGARVALGVAEGDEVPAVAVDGVTVGPTTLDLAPMVLGSPECWTTMALALRDRGDLGPFRLATMEALVRIADWRASADPTGTDLDAVRRDLEVGV